MVGILGVPLSLGSKVIGVLFAADRQRREFTAEEVALLSSLADHAAIAIDNAQLLAETRRANETISGHNEEMRRGEDAHDRLMELVLRGGDLDEVATEVAAVLGGGIVLFDDVRRRARPGVGRAGHAAGHGGRGVADLGPARCAPAPTPVPSGCARCWPARSCWAASC